MLKNSQINYRIGISGQALVNMVMNLQVPQKAGVFLD
jgi:hypothetical protein